MKTIASCLICCTALFLFFTGLPAQSAIAVEKVSMTVSNLERAVNFYTDVLQFKKVREYELESAKVRLLFGLEEPEAQVRVAVLQIGEETIELMEFSGTEAGRPIPLDSRSNDLWFQHIAIVVSDMDLAYDRVWQNNVTHVSTAPQTLPAYIPNAAGISAFYFQDPDGHQLELIHFPRKKGNPSWQAKARVQKKEPERSVFLGIDHSAIGIDQTQKGYAFWQDLLKFKISGHSENYGPEQEHLNQVFGARLLITGLQTEAGFGVEFLDYIAPPGGRPYPVDSRPTDLWHWHTTIQVEGLSQLCDQLKTRGFSIISKKIVPINENTKAFLVRDADGHAVLLQETVQASASLYKN